MGGRSGWWGRSGHETFPNHRGERYPGAEGRGCWRAGAGATRPSTAGSIASSIGCGRTVMPRCSVARQFDWVTGPLEASRDDAGGGGPESTQVRRAMPRGGAAHRTGRAAATAQDLADDGGAGVAVEQRVAAIASGSAATCPAPLPGLPRRCSWTAIGARGRRRRHNRRYAPRPEPAVMAAALEAGVSRRFRVGGAHADWRRLAFGTATIPRVDRSSARAIAQSAGREGVRGGRLRD